MNEDLGSLGNKVEQVVALCAFLRAENHRLRDLIGTLEEEKRGLADRMGEARVRLEALMDQLPE